MRQLHVTAYCHRLEVIHYESKLNQDETIIHHPPPQRRVLHTFRAAICVRPRVDERFDWEYSAASPQYRWPRFNSEWGTSSVGINSLQATLSGAALFCVGRFRMGHCHSSPSCSRCGGNNGNWGCCVHFDRDHGRITWFHAATPCSSTLSLNAVNIT